MPESAPRAPLRGPTAGKIRLILDVESPRVLLFAQRDGDLEHAVLHACFSFFCLGAFGERNRAIEAAVSTFRAAPSALLIAFGALLAPLAYDHDHPFLQVNSHVLFRHVRQI